MDFNDLCNGLGQPAPKPTPEKGVQLHGRKIDGRYYVRAADVAELLKINGVLPGIARKLRDADG